MENRAETHANNTIATAAIAANPYAKCLANAQKVNWDIDRDVIRFRTLDTRHKYLPDSLSKVNELHFLSTAEQVFLSQIQGRTYAYIFALAERCINAKIMELGRDHALGDQTALSALIQFSQEELKHQQLFERLEAMAAAAMPAGYRMTADPNDVAGFMLSRSSWAFMGLSCDIEIFTQSHYKQSIQDDENLSPLYKDVFRYHWMEEAQHATLDELEWQRIHETLTPDEVEQGVNDLIELVQGFDQVLQGQAEADAAYFIESSQRHFPRDQKQQIHHGVLKAYRWQYIVSGVLIERFQRQLSSKISAQQLQRINTALQPLIEFVG